MYCGNNNHGSIAQVSGKWYIFYHRHTNGNEFSRQACLEPIEIKNDGSIEQVEMTSCGANGGVLLGRGEYPAYIACNIFSMDEKTAPVKPYFPNRTPEMPFISQDDVDVSPLSGNENNSFITNILDNCGVGFKYFDCKGITAVKVKIRGYCRGILEVKTKWDCEPVGKIEIVSSNIWKEFSSTVKIPDGIQALYFVFKGSGNVTLGTFSLITANQN
jgi:hypothetical protein